jgi:NADH-quinone oxidoreductase subunit H
MVLPYPTLLWPLISAAGAMVFMLVSVLAVFYAERKVSAFMQDRVGPLQQGPYGVLQAVADILKLMQKGDTVPALADKPLFFMAPWVVFGAVFAGFAVVPLWPGQPVAPAGAGLFYVLAVASIEVVGVWMAGWGSHSKYPLLGAMRSVSQMLS